MWKRLNCIRLQWKDDGGSAFHFETSGEKKDAESRQDCVNFLVTSQLHCTFSNYVPSVCWNCSAVLEIFYVIDYVCLMGSKTFVEADFKYIIYQSFVVLCLTLKPHFVINLVTVASA